MINTKEYTIPSSDGISSLFCMRWIPDREAAATLQISHGMMEHIKRYDEFAKTLAGQGIAVFGHDHLGHGATAGTEDRMGYFSAKQGHICVLKDIHRVGAVIKKEYPDVPHFILGHSMGSFFLRRYLTIYGDEVDGAIIMGTGDQPFLQVLAGRISAGLIGCLKGDSFRSRLIHKSVLGNYNSRFKPVKTDSDWLSRDERKVREYVEDPVCNFYFTCNGYKNFFHILLDLKLKRNFTDIPLSLPLFILSGSEDPVGDYGKGVIRVYQQFLKLGIKNATIKLYPESRHEILNEINRTIVYEDVLRWLYSQLRTQQSESVSLK